MNQLIQPPPDPTTTLHSLQQNLTLATTPQQHRRAALAVLNAYNNIYSQYGVQSKLELLQEASTGIGLRPLLSHAERQELRVFCRFTRLLAEAALVLSRLHAYEDNE